MEEEEWDDALLSEIQALEAGHVGTHNHQIQAKKNPLAATMTSASSDCGDWTCKSCTLQNKATKLACQVCGTPRGQIFQALASTAVRKKVQARLLFDGTSISLSQQQQAEQDIGHSEISPFGVVEQEQHLQPVTVGSKANESGLALTSSHSEASCTNTPTALPLQLPRRTAGEDPMAKMRYLDIVTRSGTPQIDFEAAQHFVYPTNYSIRDYQLTIAEKALYHNTLVSLPTGLGKTLVAAVVMYNFYRWFPTGKIVFMAPTKPLVAQQIKACHEIMGIPLSDTAELQGNVPPTTRRVLWNSRRVFFCTPQSLQNDLCRKVCSAEKFVCIVVDEAHRATGNYAYCCVVQEIEANTPFFRILALSATPGAKFNVIQDVVANLRISHIESRSADDPDVRKYTHARQEEVIVCRLGVQIMAIKEQFLKLFTPIIQRLLRNHIIQNSDPNKLTSWYVLQAREKFRKSSDYASNRSAESDLALLVGLLHAKSLLTGHGLNSFRDQINNWVEERKLGKMSWSKREMLQSSTFQKLEESLAVSADRSTLTASHPKLVKLREVLLEHFQRHAAGKSSTRAIVFTQYRASVLEIVGLLRPLAPILNVQPFIGQGASGKAKENKGQSQKYQQEIVRRFRVGDFNVLVATCIAEEGLDIGEVDLIVSFDALTSPVRMIQRMGRTGRKRVGKVIILVTEGEEQKKLARSASAVKTVTRALTTFKSSFEYAKCPRMLPTGIYPQLKELNMDIPTFHASQIGGKSLSIALDPDLWQLDDAERAVAMLKYFPPNFVSSSRNRLFPVVGNRLHLLRRQARTLVRKSGNSRIGYSARSLILQGLVRKVHGIDENLEMDSDDEVSANVFTKEKNVLTSLGKSTQHLSEGKVCEFSQSEYKRQRIEVRSDSAKTDSENGSPWRQSSVLGVTNLEVDSFVTIDESLAICDTHFSPQFVDCESQFVSKNDPKNFNKICPSEPITTSMNKKHTKSREKNRGISLSTACNWPKEDKAELTEVASGGHMVSLQSDGSEEASLTQTLESSCPRSSPNKSADQQNTEKKTNFAQSLTKVSQQRSTRQLKYGENEVNGRPLSRLQSAELSPTKPAAEKEIKYKRNEVCGVKDNKSLACSIALLPTATNLLDTSTAKETPKNEDVKEKHSRVQLPSLCNSADNAPIKANVLPSTAFPGGKSTPVEDVTDRDDADETIEINSGGTSQLVSGPGMKRIEINLMEHGNDHTEVKSTKIGKLEEMTPSRKRRLTKPDYVARKIKQIGADKELGDDDCCSVCLDSESYNDDPIVFCDGCNVAVHQFCYGIQVVPSDKWFCAVCTEASHSGDVRAASSQPRCQLCPHRGGAYMRTACRQWVHVQCFLWIPELRVEQNKDNSLVLGDLTRLDSDRKFLDCSLCHSQKGYGIIQCAHNRCLTAFHVSCAAFAHYRMDQVDSSSGEESGGGIMFLVFCPLHRNSIAPCCCPQQQRTPVKAKSNHCNLPLPTPPVKLTSPSHLLASPPSAEAKQKYKTYRRLKRKYDTSQSQMFSQTGAQDSPVVTSPSWRKCVRRLKKRRETSRVLAAAYIDDVAEVRGEGQDDDDDDEYGDDYQDAADDSFINDSSQLLYSQSVESFEEIGNNKSVKKKLNNDMRAIYARSLVESQSPPLLLGRRQRHFKALPSNGIIRACLKEMRDQPELTSAPSDLKCASTTIVELDRDDSDVEAETPPSFDVLKPVTSLQSVKEVDEDDDDNKAEAEMALPTFDLLKACTPLTSTINTALKTLERPGRAACPSNDHLAPNKKVSRQSEDSGDELLKKIEIKRLEALRKLERHRQAKVHQVKPHPSLPHDRILPLDNEQFASKSATQSASVLSVTTAKVMHNEEADVALFNPSSPTSTLREHHSLQQRSMKTTDGLASRRPGSVETPKWIIFVSSAFATSDNFSEFLLAKFADCTVSVAKSTEADALLSVHTAVLFLTSQQLHELALASSTESVATNQRVKMLMAIHKKVILAIVHNGGELPYSKSLRQYSTATVIIRPRLELLYKQLHQMANQERLEGYELPFPSLCRPDFEAAGVRALDADFASRLKFFRSISHLSLDSALSLSFRFKNFSSTQVPVLKFNEMHWKRMLPWISETAAEKIRNHVQQFVLHRC